jgi:outer membrane protein OmpA-like peptidoglycan-associated protein
MIIRAPRLAAVSVVLATVVLSGCTSVDPYTGQQRTSRAAYGAGIGALAGAALGALSNTSHSKEMQKNALIGAGIGALAGGGVGSYMDHQAEALSAELRGTGVSVTRDGNQIILNMPGNVTFPTNGSDVNGSFYPVLQSVAKVLNHYNQTLIDVQGFTDSTGSAEHNQTLSQQRANSVAAYLAGQGVMPGRMNVTGRGEAAPIASNATAEGRSQNRRVEIQISPYES